MNQALSYNNNQNVLFLNAGDLFNNTYVLVPFYDSIIDNNISA